MNIEIFSNPTDDPRFVELAKQIIVQLVTQSCPEKIFVMKVDNWFDHKMAEVLRHWQRRFLLVGKFAALGASFL